MAFDEFIRPKDKLIDISIKGNFGNVLMWYLLFVTTSQGKLDSIDPDIIVDMIESGVDLNCKLVTGHTALQIISGSGFPNTKDLIHLLIRAGFDVNLEDQHARWSLQYAFKHDFSLDEIRDLIRRGCKMDNSWYSSL